MESQNVCMCVCVLQVYTKKIKIKVQQKVLHSNAIKKPFWVPQRLIQSKIFKEIFLSYLFII